MKERISPPARKVLLWPVLLHVNTFLPFPAYASLTQKMCAVDCADRDMKAEV